MHVGVCAGGDPVTCALAVCSCGNYYEGHCCENPNCPYEHIAGDSETHSFTADATLGSTGGSWSDGYASDLVSWSCSGTGWCGGSSAQGQCTVDASCSANPTSVEFALSMAHSNVQAVAVGPEEGCCCIGWVTGVVAGYKGGLNYGSANPLSATARPLRVVLPLYLDQQGFFWVTGEGGETVLTNPSPGAQGGLNTSATVKLNLNIWLSDSAGSSACAGGGQQVSVFGAEVSGNNATYAPDLTVCAVSAKEAAQYLFIQCHPQFECLAMANCQSSEEISGSGTQSATATVHYSAVDIDVDSDNTSLGPPYAPDRTQEEEDCENDDENDDDRTGRLVKLLANPNNPEPNDLVDVVIEVPEFLDELQQSNDPIILQISGPLRLWKQDLTPLGAGGSYLPEELGLQGTTLTLLAGGVGTTGRGTVKLGVCAHCSSPSQYFNQSDTVVLTVVPDPGEADLDIDSDNDCEIAAGSVCVPDSAEDLIEEQPPGKILKASSEPEDRVELKVCIECPPGDQVVYSLTWTPAERISIWHPDGFWLGQGQSMLAADPCHPFQRTFYVQGNMPGEGEIVLTAGVSGQPFGGFGDRVVYTVVSLDLDMDIDGDGDMDEEDETDEEDPGKYICTNQNDDDVNHLADARQGYALDENDVPFDDDDLHPLHLAVHGAPGLIVELRQPGFTRLWTDKQKSAEVELDADGAVRITMDSNLLEVTYWVEAYGPGDGPFEATLLPGIRPMCPTVTDAVELHACGLGEVTFKRDGLPEGVLAQAELGDTNDCAGGQTVHWSIIDGAGGYAIDEDGSITGDETADAEGVIVVQATLGEGEDACKAVGVLSVGCEGCVGESCAAGEGLPENGSISLRLNLGRVNEGHSGGAIQLYAKRPNKLLASPRGLLVTTLHDNLTPIYDIHGDLAQVLAPDGLADISYDPGAFKTTINFYDPADVGQFDPETGRFPLIGRPTEYSRWELYNPGGAGSYYTLIVRRIVGGSITEYWYVYTREGAAWTWELTVKEDGQELRRDVRAWTNGGLTCTVERYEDGGLAYKAIETYSLVAERPRLTALQFDPDGDQLTTVWTYCTNGRLESVTRSDGSWSWFNYDAAGRLSESISPWCDSTHTGAPNAAEHRAVYYTYEVAGMPEANPRLSPRRPRLVEEKVLGQTVSKTYHAYYREGDARVQVTERCSTTGAHYGDAANLRTVTGFVPDRDWEVASVEYPDGTQDTYSHELGEYNDQPLAPAFTPGSGTDRRTTVVHGTAAHPNGIALRTTATATVRTRTGRTLFEETSAYTGQIYASIGWTSYERDARGHVTDTNHSNGTLVHSDWDCCHESDRTDEQGIHTGYEYDGLRRLQVTTRYGVPAYGDYPAQADITTTYAYATISEGGRTLRQSTTTVAAGALTLATVEKHDLSGRPRTSIDEGGFSTTYEYGVDAGGGRTVTVTRPGHPAEVTTYYRDGRVKSVTRGGVRAEAHTYDLTAGKLRTTTVSGPVGSTRQVQTIYDLLGRQAEVIRPAFGGGTVSTIYSYDTVGRLFKVAAPGQAPTLYEYDELGAVARTGLNFADGGTEQLDLAGSDRITETVTEYELDEDVWWRKTTTWGYLTTGDGTPRFMSMSRERLTGLGGAPTVSAQSETESADGNVSSTTTYVDRDAHLLTVETISPDSIGSALTISYNGLQQQTVSKSGATVAFTYDDLGRRLRATGPRPGVWTETEYGDGDPVPKNRVWKTRTSDGGSGAVTEYHYDAAGKTDWVLSPAGKYTRYGYDSFGRPAKVWGDLPQPTWIEYTDYGEREKLHTYRTPADPAWFGTSWPTSDVGDVTRWSYDAATGLLVQKTYAYGTSLASSVGYTYKADGRLATRTTARNIITTYRYGDDLSEADTAALRQIVYSVGTPTVTYTYERFGALHSVVDAAGTHTFTYSGPVRESETIEGGLYGADVTITQLYEPGIRGSVGGRYAGVRVGPEQDPTYLAEYGYDDYGRLNRVLSGPGLPTGGVEYSYLNDAGTPVADVVTQTDFLDATDPLLRATRSFDPNRNVLTGVVNTWTPAGTPTTVSSYAYTNDTLARRDDATRTGAAFEATLFDDYDYNSRNELEDADLLVGGTLDRALDYTYDPIGNRLSAVQADGTTATTSYYRDQLNRYFRVETAAAEYLVQGLRYDEDGNLVEYYIAADMNCDGVMNLSDQNAFVLLLSQGRAAYEAQYPNCNWLNGDINGDGTVGFGDINPFVALLTRCGGNGHGLTAQYQWDAENRLAEVGPAEGVTPEAGDLRLEFAYDHLGRRVQKRVTVWDPTLNGGDWSAVLEGAATHRFLWDGWRMLIEWIDTPDADVTRTYTWGLDLGGLNGATGPRIERAGRLDAAGTIGGLLALHDNAGTPTNPADDREYAYLYDGNGNVGQLVAWAAGYDGTSGYGWDTTPPTRVRLVARYEYDPYGQTIGPDPDDDGDWLEHAGPYALDNPFRFSTKYWDDETGLGYWGYRYYSPGLGRWVSRDPIQERGGNNLYSFIENRPSNAIDPRGLSGQPPTSQESCKCGPDMTAYITAAMAGIGQRFKDAPQHTQYRMCKSMTSLNGWDSGLVDIATKGGSAYYATANCPSPGCGGSIQIRGNCFNAADVNYLFWGLAWSLCDDATMLDWKSWVVDEESMRRVFLFDGEQEDWDTWYLEDAITLMRVYRSTVGWVASHIWHKPNEVGYGSKHCREVFIRAGWAGSIPAGGGPKECTVPGCGPCPDSPTTGGYLRVTIGKGKGRIEWP